MFFKSLEPGVVVGVGGDKRIKLSATVLVVVLIVIR